MAIGSAHTLVMCLGGNKFSDYWRMGLLLEIIVAAVAIPLILVFCLCTKCLNPVPRNYANCAKNCSDWRMISPLRSSDIAARVR